MGRTVNRDNQHATIKEVAQLAGVARSSVSRALNDHPDVSAEMKARVLRAAERLGYQPDFLAQSLRRGATRTVGFIVRDISIPLFADIVKGAEQELESHGYSVLLMNSFREPALEAKHVDVLSHRRVDGLILSLASEASTETIRALHKIQVPTVLLDRELSGVALDSVLFDHAAGVHDAVAALLELGHRHIGLIVGSPEIRPSRERLRGFTNAYEEAGMPVRWEDVVQMGTFTPDFAVKATLSLLDKAPPPTAIVAGDSQLGVGLLAALSERGAHHGRDVAIVICDDLELLRFMDPPVSVVYRDAEAMGTAAARLLLKRLGDPSGPPVSEVLPTRFIHRGSTRPPGAVFDALILDDPGAVPGQPEKAATGASGSRGPRSR